MKRNHIIELQRHRGDTWQPLSQLHARVNQNTTREQFDAGAIQAEVSLTFDVWWSPLVASIQYKTQLYRILYNQHIFNITGYDDYMESHKTVRLTGVCVDG